MGFFCPSGQEGRGRVERRPPVRRGLDLYFAHAALCDSTHWPLCRALYTHLQHTRERQMLSCSPRCGVNRRLPYLAHRRELLDDLSARMLGAEVGDA